MSATPQNFDPAELAKFNSLAHRWWDPQGAFRPLHDMNPLRMGYLMRVARPRSKAVLDVGCGGGILAESLAKCGAHVTAIDLARDALEVAQLHALEANLQIDYRLMAAESLAQQMPAAFDVVTCMEMLEHVPDPGATLAALAALVRPGGDVIVSTLNRNLKSFALAILGAEYLTAMLPRGTHDYSKFIRPSELARWARGAGLALVEISGLAYNPWTRSFRLTEDADVNYIAHFRRAEN